jgi:hypothetical protein
MDMNSLRIAKETVTVFIIFKFSPSASLCCDRTTVALYAGKSWLLSSCYLKIRAVVCQCFFPHNR